MRIRGAKTDLQEAGEEVDEYVNSTSKMREELKALTGVDIMVNDKQFKDLFVIMDEMSTAYKTLSDIDKANVTEILFGKLRANVGASILNNFDQAEKALNAAQTSAGSAMTEHQRWLESIEASEAKAAAAFEEFSTKLVNSDIVKGFYDTETSVVGFLTKLIDLTGSAIPLVTTLGAGLLSLKGNIGISKVNMPYPTFLGAVA